MRPSRTALSLTGLVAAAGTAALALAGGSSATVAAPAPKPSVSAPVAHQPQVVAQAAVAPKKATTAPAKPAVATKKAVTRTVTVTRKPVARKTVATKPAATTAKPAAKPAATTTTTSAVRTGNDYPYASATTNENDKWGFTERQCVSFAAWRLARAGHAISNSQGYGSAFHWDEAARTNGVRVSTTPHVGAIAQWNVGEAGKVWMNGGQGTFHAGEYGHVGYVAAVYSDGSALIEQYNVMGDRSYSVLRMTAPRYLF
jgi:surface antigen